MIIPDLNLLVYCFNASARDHEAAVRWWESLLNSDAFVGIPWVVYLGFVRLMTGRHVLRDPYTPDEIMTLVAEWFSRPTIRLLGASDATRTIFEGLVSRYQLAGAIATDAVIAASAIEHDATLHTNDTDFARFVGIRLHNPLEAARP